MIGKGREEKTGKGRERKTGKVSGWKTGNNRRKRQLRIGEG